MSEREPLFREEAVQHQKKKASAADLVRLTVGWAKAGFWLVVLAVVAIVTAASIVRVERVALALAMVEDDGTVTALLPAGQGAAPENGTTATYLPADQSPDRRARVVSVEEAVPAERAREEFPGLALAIAGPVTIVRTSAIDSEADFGQLRVRTGSEPIIVAFVPGLRELLGGS
ncbi:MAG: hypothetical protein M3271_04915 [Actinomycetota bacterium]|nr:hypothetical protein [Actinomycetota bacterium]